MFAVRWALAKLTGGKAGVSDDEEPLLEEQAARMEKRRLTKTCFISLENLSDNVITFNVKNSSDDCWLIAPKNRVLESHESRLVAIEVTAASDLWARMEKNDCFLFVFSTGSPEETNDGLENRSDNTGEPQKSLHKILVPFFVAFNPPLLHEEEAEAVNKFSAHNILLKCVSADSVKDRVQ